MKYLNTLLIVILLLLVFSSFGIAKQIYQNSQDYYHQLESRRQVILSALAGQTWMEGNDHRRRIYLGVIKVYTGIDEKNGLQYLKDSVDDSIHWGSFNTYSVMDAVLRLSDKLPPAVIEKAKFRLAEHFGNDKGFTENHKLQYRTARYLYAQTWPDGPVFKDGMTPPEAMKEAETWIYDWIDRTVSVGMLEYDSVNYHSLYLLCCASLYDFATDPLMRQKAWMMMQLLLADWAPEYLNGNWIGSHSREKYNQVTHTVLNCGVAIPFGYLFFGNSQFHPELPEIYYVGLAAVQNFKPLAILGSIATDRNQPYIHKEKKAPRKGFGICKGELPIWKYDYVTKDYALYSSFGDITAVENHRWGITWVSKRDGSTCFFINPSYSAERLLYFFDSTPQNIIGEILKQRPYYKDPNKWIEGSIYEELLQHKNAVIALYNIPKHARNKHVNGFFSKIIENRIEDKSGWIFCQSDSVYFAVRPLTKGEWHEEQDHYRLTLNNRQTGVVMEAAQSSDYSSFNSFQKRILQNKLDVAKNKLKVRYVTSQGDILDFTYKKERKINNMDLNFDNWQLFDGPYVNSKLGSKIITIQYKGQNVTLDFNNFSYKYTISEAK